MIKTEKIQKTEQHIGNPLKKLAYYLKKKVLSQHHRSFPYPFSDLYTGLVFGQHGTKLPDVFQHMFKQTGLTHLLVVSGSQVSLVAGIVSTLLKSRIPHKGVFFFIMTLINSLFYLMTGGGPSIFRAVLMNETMIGLSLISHKTYPLHIISATGLIMLLINPFQLFDVGAQLSFIATSSLIYGVGLVDGLWPKTWKSWIKNTLSLSVSPFLFTMPWLWYQFQTINFVSLLSNLLVIQAIEWLVVIGFFSTLIGFFIFPIAYVINQTAFLMMIILTKVVSFLAPIKFGSIFVTKPPLAFVWVAYTVLIGSLVVYQKKPEHHKKLMLSFLLTATFFLTIPLLEKKDLTLTFIDVGQGDATLIQTPHHKNILIDTGKGAKFGSRDLIPTLKASGVNVIDLLIITHFDLDHVGGAIEVMKNFPVKTVVDNGSFHDNYADYYQLIKTKKITHKAMTSAVKIQFNDGVILSCLYPFESGLIFDKKNNNSIVTKLSYKSMDFLFTGDLEKDAEAILVNTYSKDILDVEVLKLGHHGSKTSTIPSFLEKTSPWVGIVSAGRKNRYKHPSQVVIDRIKENNVYFLTTQSKGAIIMRTNGFNLFYRTWI